jgi:hypothetical protein
LPQKKSYIHLKLLPHTQAFILLWLEKYKTCNCYYIFYNNFIDMTTTYIGKMVELVSNNWNLTYLQITNQFALPVMLSILLLLWPTVCCTRIQSVCLIDNISIQFVAKRLLSAKSCWMLTV